MKSAKENIETKKEIIILVLLTVLGGFLRFFRLGNNSLWIDEIGQVFVSNKSIPGIISGISYHLSPPLDYILLHVTLLFGKTDFLIRLNSVLFGIFGILAIYYLTKVLFNSELAFVSAILLALSRFHIHYSQEARMYSLFCLLTIVSFILLWLFTNRNKRLYLYLLLFVDLAGLYTHYYHIFVIITHITYLSLSVLLPNQFRTIKEKIYYLAQIYLGYLFVGILYLPWVKILLIQLNRDYNQSIPRFYITQDYIGNIVMIFSRASWRSIYVQVITRRFENAFQTPWPQGFFSPFELIFIMLAIIGLIQHYIKEKHSRKSLLLITTWILVPLILVSIVNGNMASRYFLFLLPPYLIMVALGIQGCFNWLIKQGKLIPVGWSILILTLAIPIGSSLYSYYFHFEKDNWREVGEFLEEHAKQDDTIILLGGNSEYLRHYYQGSSVIIDADHMYDEKPAINSLQDLSAYVTSNKCSWIFVTKHTNTVFGHILDSRYESIRALLRENMDVVEEVYHEGGYDLPGLYQSNHCKPYIISNQP